MSIQTAAGAKFSIGTTTAASSLSVFSADTYEEVGEIESMGEFGDQVSPVNFTALADRRVRKAKGTYDAGDLTLTVGFDGSDQGQLDLTAALNDTSSDDYNFKVEFEDGDTFYFRGKVMSRRINVGNADSVITATISIAINSAILEA